MLRPTLSKVFIATPLEIINSTIELTFSGKAVIGSNAFLPEIAPLEEQDDISARGFIMGYIGSIILLIICLAMIMGIGAHLTKYSFILVGLWWVVFAQRTYRVLPSNPYKKKPEADYIWKGFRELKIVYKEFMQTTRLKKYLYAFFWRRLAPTDADTVWPRPPSTMLEPVSYTHLTLPTKA